MVKNKSSRRICEVMTDNAHELSMGEMRTFCETEGIRISTTVPYHPASNGIAKRMIGVLTGAVWAMLHDSGLPKSLWAKAFNTATYMRNRVLTGVLDGRTPYKMVYGVKPDVADLQAFSAPCAVVEPAAKLKKLDDWVVMCVFVGYKYSGGGYRVWDPRKSAVVECRDIMFFEDGLPPPTFRDLASRPDDADEVLTKPRDDAPDKPLTVPATTPLQGAPDARPRIIVKLPGWYMKGTARPISLAVDEDITSIDEGPINNVARVPDFPEKSLRSRRTREEPGGESCAVAFTAGLPGRIQLMNLPDPWSMCKAMAAPDADGWQEAMDREMENLRSHDVYELVPQTPSMHTLRLSWVLHQKFKNGTFDKNKACIVAHGNHQ
jgi:hypothetical protein